MKHPIISFIIMAGLLFAAPAHAAINIFACEPEWGALAKEIGGNHVSVTIATSAKQDVHYLRAKPSLLAKMRQADLVFCNGASLEIGWLPVLLRKAGRPEVQPGKIGYLLAANHVKKLDIPVSVDRSMGDIHPEGNPHIVTDPRNIMIVARVLAHRLSKIDSTNASLYANNLSVFEDNWTNLIQQWELQVKSLSGMNVVVYHTSWAYLLNWLGIHAIASLEPKPGIPPTTSHLETILQTVKSNDVKAILLAPFENKKAANWLSERTDIPVLALPYTVGGGERTERLEAVFNETLYQLQKVSQ